MVGGEDDDRWEGGWRLMMEGKDVRGWSDVSNRDYYVNVTMFWCSFPEFLMLCLHLVPLQSGQVSVDCFHTKSDQEYTPSTRHLLYQNNEYTRLWLKITMFL